MHTGFGNDRLFPGIQTRLRDRFSQLALELETKMMEKVEELLGIVQRDVDTLRSENVALESESQPEFRQRVESDVRRIRVQMGSAEAAFRPFRPTRA